jgi:hypothetical protein
MHNPSASRVSSIGPSSAAVVANINANLNNDPEPETSTPMETKGPSPGQEDIVDTVERL